MAADEPASAAHHDLLCFHYFKNATQYIERWRHSKSKIPNPEPAFCFIAQLTQLTQLNFQLLQTMHLAALVTGSLLLTSPNARG